MKLKAKVKPARLAAKPKQTAPALPFRLQRILVPVDFSPCSVKALKYAQAFANQSQAEIILVHIVEPISFPLYGQEIMADLGAIQADLIKAGQEHLITFSRAHAADYGAMTLLVTEGSAWGEIIAAAKTHAADLIILSTHGHTGLRHALMGSTAERVVRHAECPVLIVRDHEREFIK